MAAKKSAKPSRKSADGVTTGLLVAILAVGICILCVSIAGMLSVSDGQSGIPEVQTTVQNGTNFGQGGNVQSGVVNGNNTNTNQGVVNNQGAVNNNQSTPNNNSTQPLPDGAPQTDAEWLTFFNNAVNKLKTDAPAMTKSKQTKTADIKLSNPLGDAYVSAAKDKYLSDEIVETPIAKGDKSSAQANISPDGAAYVSMLTMADIKSITHTTDANGNYVINIAMNDVSNPDKQSSYGKIFQFMLVDDVMNTYAPDMGATVDRKNVELKYSGCSATATITPDGKVVSYETTVNANMILREAKVKIINTDLDATLYSITKYYNIAW